MEIDTTRPSPSTLVNKNWETTKVGGEYTELREKSKYSILSVSEQALVQAVDKANRAIMGVQHEFQYKTHESSGEIIITMINKDTHEIIREIPSEKFIELVEKLQELTLGAIIDEKR